MAFSAAARLPCAPCAPRSEAPIDVPRQELLDLLREPTVADGMTVVELAAATGRGPTTSRGAPAHAGTTTG